MQSRGTLSAPCCLISTLQRWLFPKATKQDQRFETFTVLNHCRIDFNTNWLVKIGCLRPQREQLKLYMWLKIWRVRMSETFIWWVGGLEGLVDQKWCGIQGVGKIWHSFGGVECGSLNDQLIRTAPDWKLDEPCWSCGLCCDIYGSFLKWGGGHNWCRSTGVGCTHQFWGLSMVRIKSLPRTQ